MMSEYNATIIQININGPTQTGKSAILQSIKKLLESDGYCVVTPDREERLNPSDALEDAAQHEKPDKDKTVIVLNESRRWYAGKL